MTSSEYRITSLEYQEMDLARVPYFSNESEPTHQRLAMCRYLARELNLAGCDEWEAMYIDATVDELCAFNTQQPTGLMCAEMMRILSIPERRCQRELKREMFSRVLPVYLQQMDLQVKSNDGFFIGGKMSWADILFAVMFEQLERVVNSKELQTIPNLISLLKRVLTIPCLQSWKKHRSPSESKLIQLFNIAP